MWKAIFAVAVLSTLAFGEVATPTHGDPSATSVAVPQVATPVDNTANLMVKLNSCLAQRPGTGSALDEQLKKLNAR